MNKRFIIFIVISFLIIYFGNYLAVTQKKEIVNTQNVKNKAEDIIDKAETSTISSEALKEREIGYEGELSNGNLKIKVNSFGAVINSIVLKEFDDGKIELISDKSISKFGISDLKIDNKYINLSNINWKMINKSKNNINFSTVNDSITFEKEIDLSGKNEYIGEMSYKIKNNKNETIDIKDFFFDMGTIKNNTSDKMDNYQVDIFSDGKLHTINSGKKEEILKFSVNNGWIGIKKHYFCSIIYSKLNEIDYVLINKHIDKTIDVRVFLKDFKIESGKEKNLSISLYFGPQNYQLLKKYGYKIYKIVNFGFFHYIALFILYLLKYLFYYTHNYGFSIILLTIIIKGILWWPTQKSYTSMKNMQNIMNKMQPRLKTIKEIYKDNPQKLNEETMKLYKEYKINPMGGCLPLLLQMPVFFALYATLTNAVELKGASFIWVWKDLSIKDPSYILPIAMGISMFVQQKISATPAATPEAATQQKMMLYLMPIMLTFFSFVWPSGLLLYWVTYNIASIVQQVIINRSN